MPRDRFPAAAIYINCRPDFVDVNVHPGKSEVRFRDPQGIRSLIVTGLAGDRNRGPSVIKHSIDGSLGLRASKLTKCLVLIMNRLLKTHKIWITTAINAFSQEMLACFSRNMEAIRS